MTTAVYVPIALALIAAFAGGGFMSYLIARRSGSGRVDTSDAKTVFDAAGALLDRLDTDNQNLRQQVKDLRIQMSDAESECKRQLDVMSEEIQQLRRTLGLGHGR